MYKRILYKRNADIIWKMILEIVFWLFFTLLLISLLLTYIFNMGTTLWEIFVSLINTKTVDLRTKFGEWAVVTGSTDGIGKAYAKELATRKINLVLISRSLEKLEKTRNEIMQENPTVEIKIIVADFSKGKEIFEKLAEQLKDIPIGILVNNVGMQYSHPMYLEEVPEDDLWDIININIGATTLMTRIVIGQMQKRGKGAIVNVSSASGFIPLPLMTVYSATKVYIISFTEALRAEYSKFGLTIQHLSPFFVNTKMNAFSNWLQVSNILVPSATTYAKNAVNTLGKIDSSTGYWSHGIQKIIVLLVPIEIRTKLAMILNMIFRKEYFKQKRNI
ncbi:inactive hydroxysteroid dehydrogenase-like protein 1 isoform X1 [Apis mellifera caucasica]|uniref:Inactive hydroxysteroid dehydrogenase-like protein 1 isoform X1 n=2 Tax=Apis mellifera TaxID=7460 RepID=A0A7M7GUF2_APIME|nr:inactive hydroxysteroid dehydrogenase-like protein 1 isoform X1 [Apis mellifera]KAG6803641.1 inactive hydroxysteroid dehydrogenase-like protein 1 isoform X1 [Apis mellifera caucasica]|eukprot:XP_006562896.1 inactive hydroxysteroid dehydrogenase-like protein 1 isoform X1 [Apis mellifera]